MCWAPVYVWILDRVLRVLRICVFNPTIKPTTATVSYDESTNMLRVEVPCRFPLFKYSPGKFCYLSVMSDARFWESHPFTIASVTDVRVVPGSKLQDEQVPLLGADGIEVDDQEPATTTARTKCTTLTFLIRPYDSFTARMRDLAAAEWPHRATPQVLVDGPYGHSHPLQMFDHVVFIVGGSGVVSPLSYLKRLTGPKRRTKSVQIHWAVREPEFAAEVVLNDMRKAVEDSAFSIDLYFSTESQRNVHVGGVPSDVTSHYKRRPDARHIIISAADRADNDSLAVVACGPARMADDARNSVIEAMDRGLCDIDYFEESFRW